MLRYDPSYTAAFYDEYGDREAARWDKDARTRFEYEVYRRHIVERIGEGDRVLDAGCGPGTFTGIAMERGAVVTCLDVSAVQLGACRSHAPGAQAYVQGSVTDLSTFESGMFDVTLALGGPISYCLDRAADAVRELRRVTKPGGSVGLSVMSLYGTVHRFLPGVLKLPLEVNDEVLRTGDLSRNVDDGHECHMYRLDELLTLLQETGLKDIELSASGWLVPTGSVSFPKPAATSGRC